MVFVSAFATPSDPVLTAIFNTTLAVFAAALLLIAVIVMLRIALMSRQRRLRRVQARWRHLLAQAAAGENTAPPHLAAADHYLVLHLWNQYQGSVKGEASEHLNRFARDAGLSDVAGALIEGNTRERLIAMATLGHLRDTSFMKRLFSLSQNDNASLSLAAASAMLRIDPRQAIPRLLPAICTRQNWPVARLLPLLRHQPALVLPLLKKLRHAGTENLPRMLELAEGLPHENLAPLLRELLRKLLPRSHDPQCLAACLKALRDPTDVALARQCLHHPAWLVRLQAVRALERLGAEADLPRFVEALCDPQWWVRRRAAQALVRLPYMNPQQIDRLRHQVSDRFAADALAQAIAERASP